MSGAFFLDLNPFAGALKEKHVQVHHDGGPPTFEFGHGTGGFPAGKGVFRTG
jgi:hypothetical protein